MNCMKCGCDISEEQVFCDDCLESMSRYPVNPNTPVVLPKRTATPVSKKVPRKKAISPETQIQILKHRIRLLFVLLVAMTLLAVLLFYPAVKYMADDHFLPGQNYKSIVSKTSTTEETVLD